MKNKKIEQELNNAVDIVTVDILNSLDFGEHYQLTDNYTLYRYLPMNEDDAGCVVLEECGIEVYQLLWDTKGTDLGIDFHVL